jgi:hypothetical protein
MIIKQYVLAVLMLLVVVPHVMGMEKTDLPTKFQDFGKLPLDIQKKIFYQHVQNLLNDQQVTFKQMVNSVKELRLVNKEFTQAIEKDAFLQNKINDLILEKILQQRLLSDIDREGAFIALPNKFGRSREELKNRIDEYIKDKHKNREEIEKTGWYTHIIKK